MRQDWSGVMYWRKRFMTNGSGRLSHLDGKRQAFIRNCFRLSSISIIFLGGRRDEPRPLETSLGLVKKILHPLLPKSWRINPAEKIADRLLKAALASKAGTHVVTSEEMA